MSAYHDTVSKLRLGQEIFRASTIKLLIAEMETEMREADEARAASRAKDAAIEAAREALEDARQYANGRRVRSGIVNASAARVADKCAAALAKLEGAK